MVGYFMMRNARNIDFSDLAIGIPSFLIVVMIAFSFSISHGLAFGFAAYTIIKLLQRQWRELKPAMWVIFVLCLIYFVVEGLA